MTPLQQALRIAEEERREKQALAKRYENVSGLVIEALSVRGELRQFRDEAKRLEASRLSREEWSNRRIAERLGISLAEARELTRENSR